MKRGLEIVALILILSAIITIAALNAPRSPTGMATLDPQAVITTCDWVMDETSSINLSGITCGPGASYGVYINASDVVLNCLDSPPGPPTGITGDPTDAPAIIIENQHNITINMSYCYIQDMGRGIQIRNSTDITIDGAMFGDTISMSFGEYIGWAQPTIAINVTNSSNIHINKLRLERMENLIRFQNVHDSTLGPNLTGEYNNPAGNYNPVLGIVINGSRNLITGNNPLQFYRDLLTITGGTDNVISNNTFYSRANTATTVSLEPGTSGNNLTGNNISGGLGSEGYNLDDTSDNTFRNNIVSKQVRIDGGTNNRFFGETMTDPDIVFYQDGWANKTLMKDCSLTSTDTNPFRVAYLLAGTGMNITNCNFTKQSRADPAIVSLFMINDSTFRNCRFELLQREEGGQGILLSRSNNNTFDNAVVIAGDDAVFLDLFSNNNIFNNSVLESGAGGGGGGPVVSLPQGLEPLSADSVSVDFEDDSDNNAFYHSRLVSGTYFVASDANCDNNNFTNCTFENFYGGIRLKPLFTLPAGDDLDDERIDILLNKAFINSTNSPYLNLSAKVRLNFLDQFFGGILVDFDDDGIFAPCTICTGITYDAAGKYVEFETPHFTTFSGNGTTPLPACNTTILTDAFLSFNLTANGTNCINFGADDIELDCKGFWIIGDGTHYGVNSSNKRNITLRNCNIKNFTVDGFFRNTNDSLIVNNSMTWGWVSAMYMNGNNNDVLQNYFRKTGIPIPVTGAAFSLVGGQGNNITGNTMKAELGIAGAAYGTEIITSLGPVGPGIFANSTNNYFADNVIGSEDNTALLVNGSSSNTFVNCTAVSNGSKGGAFPSIGIFLTGASGITPRYNVFRDCIGVARMAQFGSGIYLLVADNNTFYKTEASISDQDLNSLMPAAGGIPNVLYIDTSNNNMFYNLSLDVGRYMGSGTWISTASFLAPGPSLGNNISGITLRADNGSVRYYHTFALPNGLDFENRAFPNCLVIRNNEVFVDSAGLTFLNTTADINLTNIAYIGMPIPTVNFTALPFGGNTFEPCSNYPGLCSNFTYSLAAQTASFRVAHFTSFSTNGSPAMTCPMTITSDLNLTNDLTSTGTCITVNGSNLTIDCKGYSITGDGTGVGINMSDVFLPVPPFFVVRNNITVRNCNIDNFGYPIYANGFIGGSNHKVINNNLTRATIAGLFMAAPFSNVTRNLITSAATGLTLSDSFFTTISKNRIVSTGTALVEQGPGFGAGPNTLIDNTLTTGATWISFSGMVTADNLTNTTFANNFGHIRVLPKVTTLDTTIGQAQLAIQYNRTFLNSTALPLWNVSSQIALNGLPFAAAPTAVVDLNDNGVYVPCAAPRCTNTAYNGSQFTMDVSGWTGYAAQGAGGPGPSPSPRRTGGGGSSGVGNAVIVPPEQAQQETQKKAQKPKAAATEEEKEIPVKKQPKQEKPDSVAVKKASFIPVISKDSSMSLMRYVFFGLALLAISALGVMIFRRRKYDPEKIGKRIEEMRTRLGKIK